MGIPIVIPGRRASRWRSSPAGRRISLLPGLYDGDRAQARAPGLASPLRCACRCPRCYPAQACEDRSVTQPVAEQEHRAPQDHQVGFGVAPMPKATASRGRFCSGLRRKDRPKLEGVRPKRAGRYSELLRCFAGTKSPRILAYHPRFHLSPVNRPVLRRLYRIVGPLNRDAGHDAPARATSTRRIRLATFC